MADWQERITTETAPAIRVEHQLRYLAAAPLILGGGPWADLGCGAGIAAAEALGDGRPSHALLVDVDGASAQRAAERLAIPHTTALALDLTVAEDLRRIGDELRPMEAEPTITCFEVVEHLNTFVPLLEWANELVSERGATFVLSVPNDAFWAVQNPYHETTWSEGSFEELCALLPEQKTLLRQIALHGSALAEIDGAPMRHALQADVGAEGAVASHFLAAFGPRHGEIRTAALAAEIDMLEQRRWERQRENDAAVAQRAADAQRAAVQAQDLTLARQREDLHRQTAELDEWRVYIHELERELGRPLSGGEPEGKAVPETRAGSGES
jgi:hypothetical protein